MQKKSSAGHEVYHRQVSAWHENPTPPRDQVEVESQTWRDSDQFLQKPTLHKFRRNHSRKAKGKQWSSQSLLPVLRGFIHSVRIHFGNSTGIPTRACGDCGSSLWGFSGIPIFSPRLMGIPSGSSGCSASAYHLTDFGDLDQKHAARHSLRGA